MKEQLIRESVIRGFVRDLTVNLKSVEEELVKMSNKINKRQINGLIVNKIMNEIESFGNVNLNKKQEIQFLKLKNNINNYLNDMLVD